MPGTALWFTVLSASTAISAITSTYCTERAGTVTNVVCIPQVDRYNYVVLVIFQWRSRWWTKSLWSIKNTDT